ncbi:50S ribosomal protein L11 [Candidatus Francisella endociliophora]|uniref:50S ribosomal protein L11 n=1 Tax=Candidatus Francisella endociliophora TaxID=653937 RepID=A0A097ERC0_9GAMM|nr:MAPEG family protein [Francisella sp. FSC1006]AIT10104.1 50S ribosomal protein L11 [Francisella sp. FSC1006]
MTKQQKGVFYGLSIGIILSVAIIFVGSMCDFFHLSNVDNKLSIAFKALLAPGICLMVAIARLAKHRFFSAEDINGSGLTQGTQKAKVLQALIQNTLEQLVIAFVAYSSWSIIMPSLTMSTIFFAGIVFVIGRILFFTNYNKGAGARALGFTLTFYPSVIMIIVALIYLIV